MFINLLAIIAALLIIFLIYVAITKSGQFHYERSGVIQAKPEVIFPYLSRFTLGGEWSPYEKIDPNMKKYLGGDDGQVGSTMAFEGNSKAGSGKLEILSQIPNQEVQIRLIMTKPFKADNLVIYKLTPQDDGTRFTWSMSGDGGFMTKIMVTLIDCEKMVGDQFSEGIENLKTLIESKKNKGNSMKLTTAPDTANFPETHYVYVEKIGPFQETAQKAWQQLHENTAQISEYTKITGFMSLYKIEPEMIYLAGAKVNSKPEKIPPGFLYMKFEGGKYTRFTLTGSYSNLPEACGIAFETIEKNKTPLRDNYFIENYVNDPKVTPEAQLVTEIMMPTK